VPTLTNVSTWDEIQGRIITTAENTAKKHQHSISSNLRQFRCELCNQYVTFINGGVNIPHFKHESGSDFCDQKIIASTNYTKTNPLGFSLPLKIKIENGKIEICIGFLPLGEQLLDDLEQADEKLNISANDNDIRTFNITHNRFYEDSISYLSVGAEFAEKYKLEYSAKIPKTLWPTIVDGFDKKGTLFDQNSGRRLSNNADVIVERKYWLIMGQNLPIYRNPDIEWAKIRDIADYTIYSVKAINFSVQADEFFNKFNAKLTKKLVEITPLYPFVRQSSNAINHTAAKIWFHKTGGFVDISPGEFVRESDLFAVKCDETSIISISRLENRTNVLRYLVAHKKSDFAKKPQIYDMKISNNKGENFPVGAYTKLPKNKRLYITAPFDGFIDEICLADNLTINRIDLKNAQNTLFDVAYNRRYKIFCGLDHVAEVSFIMEEREPNISDLRILEILQGCKGRKIAINHTFGAVAEKLPNMPKTQQWILQQIRTGTIDETAKKHLIKTIGGFCG